MTDFWYSMLGHAVTLVAALATLAASLLNRQRLAEVHVLVNSQKDTLEREIKSLKEEIAVLKGPQYGADD